MRRDRVGLKGGRQQSRVRGDGGYPRARGRVRRREKVGVGEGRVPGGRGAALHGGGAAE